MHIGGPLSFRLVSIIFEGHLRCEAWFLFGCLFQHISYEHLFCRKQPGVKKEVGMCRRESCRWNHGLVWRALFDRNYLRARVWCRWGPVLWCWRRENRQRQNSSQIHCYNRSSNFFHTAGFIEWTTCQWLYVGMPINHYRQGGPLVIQFHPLCCINIGVSVYPLGGILIDSINPFCWWWIRSSPLAHYISDLPWWVQFQIEKKFGRKEETGQDSLQWAANSIVRESSQIRGGLFSQPQAVCPYDNCPSPRISLSSRESQFYWLWYILAQ